MLCGVTKWSILGHLLFICFNDFYTCLRYAKTIKFSDDTVLYFSHTDFHVIEKSLSNDTEHDFEFLTENELILNAKKEKTEVMCTSNRVSKLTVNLNICYGGETLNQTNRYKYLGTLLDPSDSLNDNFNVTYKNASSHLRLMEVLKENLTEKARKCVYQSMLVPPSTYICIANLNLIGLN